MLCLGAEYHWRNYETYDLNIKTSALIFHDFQVEELLKFSRKFFFAKNAWRVQSCHVNLHPIFWGGDDDVEVFSSLVPHVWNQVSFVKKPTCTYQVVYDLHVHLIIHIADTKKVSKIAGKRRSDLWMIWYQYREIESGSFSKFGAQDAYTCHGIEYP